MPNQKGVWEEWREARDRVLQSMAGKKVSAKVIPANDPARFTSDVGWVSATVGGKHFPYMFTTCKSEPPSDKEIISTIAARAASEKMEKKYGKWWRNRR